MSERASKPTVDYDVVSDLTDEQRARNYKVAEALLTLDLLEGYNRYLEAVNG